MTRSAPEYSGRITKSCTATAAISHVAMPTAAFALDTLNSSTSAQAHSGSSTR